jgi:hypothetical protein
MHINPISLASYQSALASSLNTATATQTSLPAGASGTSPSTTGPIRTAFEETLSSELGLTAPSTATGTSTGTSTAAGTGTATTGTTNTADAQSLVKALRAFEAALYHATGGGQRGSSAGGAPSSGVTSGGAASGAAGATAELSTNSQAYTGFENRLEGVIQGLATTSTTGGTPDVTTQLDVAYNNLVSAAQTATGTTGTAGTTTPSLQSFLTSFEQNLQAQGALGTTAASGSLVSTLA